jgi:Family of unknown function (DUF5677)
MSQKAFDTIHQELAEYIEDVNRGRPAYLEKHRKPYESLFEAIRYYFVFMSYVGDQMDFSGKRTEPLVLYYQVASHLAGLEACLREGQHYSAAAILRALFETEVMLALLMEADTESRCSLYSEYEKMGRWFNLEAHRVLLTSGVMTQTEFDARFPAEWISTMTADYNAVKVNYHPTAPGTYGWAWSIFRTAPNSPNPTLSRICDRLNCMSDYKVLYGTLSAVAHASSVSRRAITASDGMISPGPIYDGRTTQYLMMGLSYCQRAFNHVQRYLGDAVRDNLKLYSVSLWEGVLKSSPDGEKMIADFEKRLSSTP